MKDIDFPSLNRLTQLWSDVALFKINDAECAMQFFLQGVKEMLDANSLVWVPAVARKNFSLVRSSELLGDWFIFDAIYVGPRNAAEQATRYEQYMQLKQKYGGDLLTEAVVRDFGKTTTHLRKDCMCDEDWERYWLLREFYDEVGTSDVMHAITNIDADCEACIIAQSKKENGYFSEGDRNLLHVASSGVIHLHKKLMALRGASLPCSQLFSSQERSVLKGVLDAKREKEIAEELGLATSTVSKHVASLYRKAGVSGKYELMKQFVS